MRVTNLERVAPVSFAVDHLQNILVYSLAALVAVSPVVGGTHTIFADVEVLGIVNIPVRPRLDAVDYLCSRSQRIPQQKILS